MAQMQLPPGGWSYGCMMMKWQAEFQQTLSNNTIDFLCSQYFDVQPTPLSNCLTAWWRQLDLFQQVGEASYIVTAINYIW